MKTAHETESNKKRLKKQDKKSKRNKKNLVFKLHKTILHHFPDLSDRIKKMEDCRKKKDYELAELIVAVVMMSVMKKESRNAFNNEREEEEFKNNYEKIFKVRLPRMDTADSVMRELKERELEKLKTVLVKTLLKKKTFHKYRMKGGYHRTAVDGTHVMTVNEGHCENCLHRTSETGKMTYFHNVLEAELVTGNGFSVSLGTERTENPSGDYDKQDCELKAFVRLAENLKKEYPRLPICIIADGLYPNQTFFDICKKNGWARIVTFKDGNLPSVTVKIAKGEYKPEPDAPKIWFESLQTMAQLLSKENMHLLKVIDETEPESITALAQATGRKKNNLSRTLRKMQRYGILELKQQNRCVKPVVKATDFRIEYGLNPIRFCLMDRP